jgi:histidinol-phosphate phosphatase family protein
VFLDRDGTLVRNARHPVRPDQLALYPETGEALQRLRDAGARLLVVSNQSAVARGLLSPSGLRRMDAGLRKILRGRGVRLDRSAYCPHHPDWTGPCACRKPEPGLILEGLAALRLEASRCYLIGDTVADLKAGRAAGLRTVLVLTGHGRGQRERALRDGLADHVAARIGGAASWILADRAHRLS